MFQRKDKRAQLPSIMDFMKFSDSEPYDIPIGDLLASDDEVGNAKVKLFSEEMDVEAKVTKEKRKKIIMQRRVKVRTDDAKEGGQRLNRLIKEQSCKRSRMMVNGEERKGESVKKRKASKEEEGEYWEGPDEKVKEKKEKEDKEKKEVTGKKEANEEDGKKSLERSEKNLQILQKDFQVKLNIF